MYEVIFNVIACTTAYIIAQALAIGTSNRSIIGLIIGLYSNAIRQEQKYYKEKNRLFNEIS